jgi:hypothetical protein
MSFFQKYEIKFSEKVSCDWNAVNTEILIHGCDDKYFYVKWARHFSITILG